MSQPPPRPVAQYFRGEEFASKTYFDKLEQQKQQQQRDGAAATVATPALVLPPHQSPFILPVRDSRPVELVDEQPQPEPKQKKSRFGLSRLLHSNKSQAAPAPAPIIEEPRFERRSTGSDLFRPKRIPFDELFLSLPAELQIQVIASLPLSDILNLRLASRAWHSMVTANESPIARYHLDNHVPAYAKRLYPPPDTSNINFHYLCSLWHRLHVAAKMSFFIGEWVTREIFLRTTPAQKAEFAPQQERMRRRLIPLLFTIFHFFETYRARHVQYIIDNNGRGLQYQPYTLNPIEVEIMSAYDDRTLLQVHQIFPLVMASFCRRLRPPSYVGRAEKALRGYLRDKPADEVHVAALCIGGLRQAERFWEIKAYNTRVGAVDSWYTSLAKDSTVETTTATILKPKRGFMGLSRKKSSVGLKGNTFDPHFPGIQDSPDMDRRTSVSTIFHTSLSLGMPMSNLPTDQVRMLLPDLPILQKLWVTTAEALILERNIVASPADIKRNAQVMLELIREDGMADEDEWWYGQNAHETVRPPPESTEEDPIVEVGVAI